MIEIAVEEGLKEVEKTRNMTIECVNGRHQRGPSEISNRTASCLVLLIQDISAVPAWFLSPLFVAKESPDIYFNSEYMWWTVLIPNVISSIPTLWVVWNPFEDWEDSGDHTSDSLGRNMTANDLTLSSMESKCTLWYKI